MKTQTLDEIIGALKKDERHLDTEAQFCQHCARCLANTRRVLRIMERAREHAARAERLIGATRA